MARFGMSKLPGLQSLCLLLVCCCPVLVLQQPNCANQFDLQQSSRSKRVSKMPAVLPATNRNCLFCACARACLCLCLSVSVSVCIIMLGDTCMA